jgi:hypothetical protein
MNVDNKCSQHYSAASCLNQINIVVRTMSEEYVLLAAAASVVIFSERSGRRRRFWVRPSLHSRQRYTGRDLLRDLNCDDCGLSICERRLSGSFKNFTRISSSDFEFLLNNIGRTINKQDTNYRESIPATERLALNLSFLATGDSYGSLSYVFKISKASISAIIPEVCEALKVCKVVY